jgi:hypothetical protein
MRVFAPMLVLLAGCATQPVDLTATKESWQGVRYETVVALWGPPVRSAVLPDGRDAHTWVSESVSGGGMWFPSIGVYGSNRGVGVGVGTGTVIGQGGGEIVRCERTFIFRDGAVNEQAWQGHSRFCSSLRRN